MRKRFFALPVTLTLTMAIILETAPVNLRDAKIAEYFDEEGRVIWWWLRSPGFIEEFAAGIGTKGDVQLYGGKIGNGGVRPALWLNLEF